MINKSTNMLDGSYEHFSDRINIVKGILVLCVVIEHNFEICTLFPRIKIICEAFDVFGFFLVYFCFPSKPFSMELLKTRTCRYLIPFLWFYTLSSTLYNLIIIDIPMLDSIRNYIIGILFLSTSLIKISSGFALYWFLPCYLILVLVRSIYLLNANLKIIIMILSVSCHLLLSTLLAPYSKWIPLSVTVALYCFPICLLFETIWKYIKLKRNYQIIYLVLFILSLMLIGIYKNEMYLNTNELPSLINPMWLGIHDVCVLACIPALYCLASLLDSSRMLCLIGKYSLGIYLSHNLIYYIIKVGLGNKMSLMYTIVTILATISGAILFTHFVYKLSLLKSIIFPRYCSGHK